MGQVFLAVVGLCFLGIAVMIGLEHIAWWAGRIVAAYHRGKEGKDLP
jgi:hypothetical protein